MDVKTLIYKYISENEVMQLATLSNGRPRICTLHYVFDEKLNVYWMSNRSTRHSVDLQKGDCAAIGIIHDEHLKQCIHFEGQAMELNGEEVSLVHEIYEKRYGQKPERLNEALSDNQNVRAYYIFKPAHCVLFDQENFPDDPHQEFSDFKLFPLS